MTYLMWFSKSLRVRVTSEAAWLSSRSKCSSVQLSLQIVTSPSTARATSRTAAISCSWHAGLWRVGATTYKQTHMAQSVKWEMKLEMGIYDIWQNCQLWQLPEADLTLAQATSCEVARAHCVAAPITLFWVAWSSQVAAMFLAFSTSAAVVLATALASPSRMSCSSRLDSSSWPMVERTWCEASPTRLAAFKRFWRG